MTLVLLEIVAYLDKLQQPNGLEFYLNRPRSKGDFHGQAPVVWCAMALLK